MILTYKDLIYESNHSKVWLVKKEEDGIKSEYVEKIYNSDANTQYINEVDILRKLSDNKTNIVNMFNSTDEIYTIYLEKGDISLKKYIKKYLYNPIEIFREIVKGVKYIHSHDIVHCDLKFENILMFGTQPKIIDFGLSHREGDNLGGYIMGTLHYVSLDRILQNNIVQKYDDMWQLACIFYKLITREYLFDIYSFDKLILSILELKGFPIKDDIVYLSSLPKAHKLYNAKNSDLHIRKLNAAPYNDIIFNLMEYIPSNRILCDKLLDILEKM